MGGGFFISVDWGTSNVRVRLVRFPSLQIIEEIVLPQGIKSTYNLWKEQGGDREDYFLDFLKSQIDQFKVELDKSTTVVVSGMASSSIGMRELPYAGLPFNTDGSTLYIEEITNPNFPFQVKLISGVRSDSDVVRGEEVQIVGLTNETDLEFNTVFVMPGTHSKHVICDKGVVTDFHTFMTGEMFQVISEYTILKNSLNHGEFGEKEGLAFDEGVSSSTEGHSLLNELFKIRAYNLFGSRSETENYYFLSGLLIGNELITLKNTNHDTIKLCAGGNLFELYHRAMGKLVLHKTQIVSKDKVDASVVKGQWKIIKDLL
ncbi:2-dehydro-3-deoxygalactonokinase [Reichenbachiella sp. MALMAid0571]|uniref:2-dehydro-3-deoxygalactonokinase n=1 Tax=Reichenbachiella sp. MALMAid0571 TaxID=3143939 RepID=UPI0032DE8710